MRAFLLSSALLCIAKVATGATPDEPITRFPPFLVEETMGERGAVGETAVSFSRFDADTSPSSLADRVPNFFVADSGAHSFNNTFALRGMSNTPIFGDAAVTFYLDDIPLGGSFASPDAFTGIGRATVFRGFPSATLFGQSGSAGVIQLTTADLASNASSDIDATFGNHSARKASVTAAARTAQNDVFVSANYSARDGYLYNTVRKENVDHRENTSALGRLRFSPAKDFRLIFLVAAERARDGEQPLVPLGNRYEIVRSTQGKTAFSSASGGLTAKLNRTWGELSATTSVNDWRLGPYVSALTFGPAELVSDVGMKRRSYNEEVTASFALPLEMRGKAGVFYSQSATRGSFTRSIGPFAVEASTYTLHARNTGAFAEVSRAIGEDLDASLGLRLQRTKKDIARQQTAPFPDTYSLRNDSGAALPFASLNWRAEKLTHVFVSAGGTYKPGGFSAFTGNRDLSSFGAERSIGLEAGVSSENSSKTFHWTVRGFDYRITGYQIERSFATGGASDDYLVVNASRARSVGGEVELQWHPAKPWTLTSTYGYTRARLQSFTDPYTHVSYNGKAVPYVPQTSLALLCDYQSEAGYFVSLGWSLRGKTFFTESEDSLFAQDSYSLVNARVGYRTDRWRISAYLENALDKFYYASIAPGTYHASPGAPRLYGVECGVSF
jgi:iron complex outermembrane receptor protein